MARRPHEVNDFPSEWLAFAAIVVIVLLIGYLNAQDIKNCTNSGHSEAVCLATYNP